VILKRRCQLALTRITHQVSRAFDLKKERVLTKCINDDERKYKRENE
jgi:hypothetical protein